MGSTPSLSIITTRKGYGTYIKADCQFPWQPWFYMWQRQNDLAKSFSENSRKTKKSHLKPLEQGLFDISPMFLLPRLSTWILLFSKISWPLNSARYFMLCQLWLLNEVSLASFDFQLKNLFDKYRCVKRCMSLIDICLSLGKIDKRKSIWATIWDWGIFWRTNTEVEKSRGCLEKV